MPAYIFSQWCGLDKNKEMHITEDYSQKLYKESTTEAGADQHGTVSYAIKRLAE